MGELLRRWLSKEQACIKPAFIRLTVRALLSRKTFHSFDAFPPEP
jgi:hypothetical protein